MEIGKAIYSQQSEDASPEPETQSEEPAAEEKKEEGENKEEGEKKEKWVTWFLKIVSVRDYLF